MISLLCEAIDCGPPTNQSDIEVNGTMNTSLDARVFVRCKQFGFTFPQNFLNVEHQCGKDSKWKPTVGNIICVRMREIRFVSHLTRAKHTFIYIFLMLWTRYYLFKAFLTLEIEDYCSDALPTPSGAISETDYNRAINSTITFTCADQFQPANGNPPKTRCTQSTHEKGIWRNVSGACIRIFSLLFSCNFLLYLFLCCSYLFCPLVSLFSLSLQSKIRSVEVNMYRFSNFFYLHNIILWIIPAIKNQNHLKAPKHF